MRSWRLALSTALILVAIAVALPGVVYVIGLAKVQGRPGPAQPVRYTADDIHAAWRRCGEKLPLKAQPLSPWQYANRFLFSNPRKVSPGERAAWQIASSHNAQHPVGRAVWWHTSGAALTIWLTRNWSTEQLGATLVRDNLCR